jgi:nucleotidyltransferase substrate binding protein (TIGR01987 family)
MAERWIVDDFAVALTQFETVLKQKVDTDLLRAGCIQYFEFTFELAWKSIKQVAEEMGLPACTSPRACLKTAFQQEWIDDETIWLDMLEARNRMSHTYDSKTALAIFDRLAAYPQPMNQLLTHLKSA